MINFNSKIGLFKSEVLNQEFDNIIESDGPLSYIINNYGNIPAKGGTKYPQYKDTNYLIHVLNTMYIAGILFEQKFIYIHHIYNYEYRILQIDSEFGV